MRTRRSPFARSLAAHVVLATTGLLVACVVVAAPEARSEVTTPPPSPQSEPPIACEPGATRVPGHWRWNGYQYVWFPQRCVHRPGYRYEPGGYYQCGDGWCWREGAWVQGGR